MLKVDVIEDVAEGLRDETEWESFMDMVDRERGSDNWGELREEGVFWIAEGDGGEDDRRIREEGPAPGLVAAIAVRLWVTRKTRNGDREHKFTSFSQQC